MGTRSSDVTRSSTAVAKATGQLFALAASPAVTSQDTVRVPVDKEGSRDQMDFTGSLLGKFLGLTQYFPLSCSMSSPSDKLLDLLRNHFPSGGSVISVAEPVPVPYILVGAGAGVKKDVKAKTCFLPLFSLFLYEEEPEP